jgi:hypothetical protein
LAEDFPGEQKARFRVARHELGGQLIDIVYGAVSKV